MASLEMISDQRRCLAQDLKDNIFFLTFKANRRVVCEDVKTPPKKGEKGIKERSNIAP